ncbi:MAG: intermembrane phospholipid transport protein YdbH family protein [Geminicoccaceae bacterium]
MLRRIGLFAVAIGILITLLVWSLPAIIPLGLAIAGVDDVTFETLELGFRRARLDGLAFGNPPHQSVTRIEADYSFTGLLEGRIDLVRIDGLVAEAVYEDGTLSFGDASGSDIDESGVGDDGPLGLTLPIITRKLTIENSRIDVETSFGPVSLPIDGQADLVDDRLQFDIAVPTATLTTDGSGTLEASLRLSGHLPLLEEPRVDQVVASGRLDTEAIDMALPGLNPPIAMTGAMDLQVANGLLTFEGPITAASRAGSADGELAGAVLFDERLRPVAIEGGEAAFELAEISFDDIDLERGRVGLRLDGALDDLTGALTVDLDRLKVLLGEVEVRGLKMQRVLDLKIRDNGVDVAASIDGDKISVDQVAIGSDGARVMESGWFTIQWPGREEPWLRLNLDERQFDLDWRLEVDPVRVDLATSRFWARIEDLAVTLTGGPRRVRDSAIRIRKGRVDLPSTNIALVGIESDIHLSGPELEADGQIPLTIRAVRPLDEPRLFAPLRLDARVDPERSTFDVEGTLVTTSGSAAVLDFTGRHDIEANQGTLDLDFAPFAFGPGRLQPTVLFPILDGVIDEAEGSIALNGQVAWQDGRLASDLALLIDELGFAIGPARLSRVNSVIRFDGIAPLTTPGDQLLSVGLLDVGLPLTDGLVSMQLRPDGRFSVDQLTWRLAEGQIRAEPFTFGSDVKDLTLMLKAEQLDLDALLRLTPLDDLTGEGRIDGILPLTIGEAAAIEDGELAATGPGVLRYTPSTVPGVLQAGGESVRLMLQALENFRYEALKITLDGRTDGANAIGLHLKGANPDLYDGHPVEFNLNLEGNLASLVQANLDNYQIPDRIRERIQGFER